MEAGLPSGGVSRDRGQADVHGARLSFTGVFARCTTDRNAGSCFGVVSVQPSTLRSGSGLRATDPTIRGPSREGNSYVSAVLMLGLRAVMLRSRGLAGSPVMTALTVVPQGCFVGAFGRHCWSRWFAADVSLP